MTKYILPCIILTFNIQFGGFNYAQANEDAGKYLLNSHREDHFGVPFLYLQGTDYEVGYQYGYLLKDELNSLYKEFRIFKDGLLDREIKYLPCYQRIFANIFSGMVFSHKINSYADQLPSNIQEQIKGASESSGLPVSFFKEIQVLVDLYSNRCEAIVIKKGVHTYHCHNLDQPWPVNMISKYPAVVNYDINGTQKYTDFGNVGCFMIVTAFNESGISLSENANNNPFGFDKSNPSLYREKSKIITESHNLKEVDSLVNSLKLPLGLIFTISSSREKQAVVYDLLGSTKAATRVNNYQFVANRTVSKDLGKKSETIYSGFFHDTCREAKFAELIDTTKPNIVDEAISILSNNDFYHYKDFIPVYIESLHNYETDQSVIFDLADSTIYFTYYTHYAAWNRWLKYNYITHQVSLFKEPDPRLNDPLLIRLNEIYKDYETCDWRDSSSVGSLMNLIINSHIENYFTLDFLSWKYRDYYNLAAEALVYSQKLIDKYPDIATGYYNKGRALEMENKYQEAIDAYLLAVDSKLNCDYFLAESYEHIAFLYTNLNKKEVAAGYAIKALTIDNQYWIPDYMKKRIKDLEEISKQ